MIPQDRLNAAVDTLKAQGIEVTVRVEPFPTAGCPVCTHDRLFVHVVRTSRSPASTWAAIFFTMHPLCSAVSIN